MARACQKEGALFMAEKAKPEGIGVNGNGNYAR
jgi:hypothetical protein